MLLPAVSVQIVFFLCESKIAWKYRITTPYHILLPSGCVSVGVAHVGLFALYSGLMHAFSVPTLKGYCICWNTAAQKDWMQTQQWHRCDGFNWGEWGSLICETIRVCVYCIGKTCGLSRHDIWSLFNAIVNEYAWVLKLGGIFSWWTPDFILKWLTLTNEQLHDFCNFSLEVLIIKQGHYRLVMYNALMVWRHGKTIRNALVMHYWFIPSSVVNSLLCINVKLIYFIV